MASLQLKLLGGFAASLPSGRPVQLVGKKNQALLAYLAVNRGKRHSREKLMGLLWGDRGESQARGSLRQALAALKEALAGIEPAPLVLDGDSVALDPAAVSTDVAEFEALAGSGSVDDLRQAAKLYEGDLLEEMAVPDPGFGDWLSAERARLREAVIGAIGRLTAQLTGTEAIAMGKRLIALDPLREASHRALMQAYAAAGEKSLALQHYATCRDLLKAELGVTPARETEELRQSLLEGKAALAASRAPTGPSPSPPKPISVAVLPFANMSGDSGQDYFADGLTDDLSTALAKCRQVSVAASSSTFQYRNRSVRAQDVGRELGVGYVLEGSVRKDGNRVRVTAQLVDTETGAQLWAERFDRELADIFAVQDEVVRAILAQLVYSLVDAAAASRRDAPTKSLTAYDHFLRARSAWRRFAVVETRDHLLQAIEADPNYAVGLAALAHLYSEDRFMQMLGVSVQEAKKLAEAFVERAIVNDAGDAVAHTLLGCAYLNLGKHDKARHHLELALSLNPYYSNTVINLGCAIALAGQHHEGLAEIEKAFWLEPRTTPSVRAVRMYVHYLTRDYEKAIADFDLIDNAAAFLYLLQAMCLAQAGRPEEAKRAVAAFDERRSPQFDIAGLAQAYCDMTRLPEDKEHWLEGFRKLGLQV